MNRTAYDRIGDTLYHEVLENKLNIFVAPKRDFAKSFAFFATNYGGIDMDFTSAGRSITTPAGVAHFLEHKMFDMPEGNALQTLTALGASPNAFTSLDITGYYFETTSNFAKCLETLLSFVSTPYYTDESVDKEQGIIAQEIKMYDDHPEYNCSMGLYNALYRKHPIKAPIAGTVESIAGITAQTLYDCHAAFYNPANMVLCVVGDVDPEFVVNTARSVLPGEPGVRAEYNLGEAEPEEIESAYTERSMEVASPLFYAGYKCDVPPYGRETLFAEYCAGIAADTVMGSSSPLYIRLYEQGLIDSGFSFGYDACRGAALLTFGGKSKDPAEVSKRVAAEVKRIVGEGIDRQYFERRKKAAFGKMIRMFNSFENICIGQASTFLNGANMYDLPELFDTISVDAVLEYIRQNFREERMALSVINPAG